MSKIKHGGKCIFVYMLQAFFIEENKEKVIEGLKKRYLLEIEGMLSIIKKILYLFDDKKRIQLKRDGFFFLSIKFQDK